jgi:hypothetical protein
MNSLIQADSRMAGLTDTGTTRPAVKAHLWFRTSVLGGNLMQLGGLSSAGALLALAGQVAASPNLAVPLTLAGLAVVLLSSHAIGHWLVGRLLGIRFNGYSVQGSGHLDIYPPGIRQVMSFAPFFAARTERGSMRDAAPWAQALMFAAGKTTDSIATVAYALAAFALGLPSAHLIAVITIVAQVFSTIAVIRSPGGDYAKALRALKR